MGSPARVERPGTLAVSFWQRLLFLPCLGAAELEFRAPWTTAELGGVEDGGLHAPALSNRYGCILCRHLELCADAYYDTRYQYTVALFG